MHYLDIVDCNAGDHGQAFATNFNPEINIREITQDGKYWENGEWKVIPAMSIHKPIEYPNIGPKESYLLYHEELESLVKNFPTIKRARFWMTFGQAYLTHLEVMQNIGITSIKPIMFQGREIIPIEFLKALLPEPGSLGENYSGETSIGCQIKGIKDGKDKTYFIWNNCKHQDAYNDAKAQGVSYTTGVPAMLGAKLMLEGIWMKPGVYNTEEMDPDPFMSQIGGYGLPWHEAINPVLPHEY
jgi:saccharopine dehydrogenase (NAD+, L-lysine-forming)